MSGALQRCLEECLKLITLSVIGNRFAVVAVEIRPPPARTKIGPLACYERRKTITFGICVVEVSQLSNRPHFLWVGVGRTREKLVNDEPGRRVIYITFSTLQVG